MPTTDTAPNGDQDRVTDSAALRVHRAARTVLALIVLDIAVAVAMDIVWQWQVPFLVGWCLSWLTAVMWVNFREVRNDH